MTQAQKQALLQIASCAGWVHARAITQYRGANVSTLRALIKNGLVEETAADGYPGFRVRISDAGRAELST